VIKIPQFGINATGYGQYSCTNEDKFNSKGMRLSVASKMAYAKACSDAFTTLAIVVLPSEKCYVAQIDTTENIQLDFEVRI
jgi:hypothetical protein